MEGASETLRCAESVVGERVKTRLTGKDSFPTVIPQARRSDLSRVKAGPEDSHNSEIIYPNMLFSPINRLLSNLWIFRRCESGTTRARDQ